MLVKGIWKDRWYDTDGNKGEFVRESAQLRHWITADGSPGPSGEDGFAAEPNRYHLYVSYACPWAHRTLIFRQLKGLQSLIGVSVVSPDMLEHGWSFDQSSGSTGDHLGQRQYLHQLYTDNIGDYSGRVTVPVLWDKKRNRIVSNESSEIIRMFNSAFNALTDNGEDYYPEDLRGTIDEVNDRVYKEINNGVYRAGFATEQRAYERAVERLFEALDWLEGLLADQAYIAGDRITEADWRLFTTLIRFDAVYHGHFKCNIRQLADYHHLSNYVRALYQYKGVAGTVHFDHIKRHYYYSHTMINPTQVVPVGPSQDFERPHDRGQTARVDVT